MTSYHLPRDGWSQRGDSGRRMDQTWTRAERTPDIDHRPIPGRGPSPAPQPDGPHSGEAHAGAPFYELSVEWTDAKRGAAPRRKPRWNIRAERTSRCRWRHQ